MMFSDRSRFCPTGSDGCRQVWIGSGECYAEVCIEKQFPFGDEMVLAKITTQERTELVFIENGFMTSHRSITEILEPHVMP